MPDNWGYTETGSVNPGLALDRSLCGGKHGGVIMNNLPGADYIVLYSQTIPQPQTDAVFQGRTSTWPA